MLNQSMRTALAAASTVALMAFISPLQAQSQTGAGETGPAAESEAMRSDGSRQGQGMTGQAQEAGSSGSSTSASEGAGRDDQTAASADAQSGPLRLVSANELVGLALRSERQEEGGDIEFVLLEPVTGKVAFYVVGSGGILDLGENLTAVPAEAVKIAWSGSGEDAQPEITYSGDSKTLSDGPQFTQEKLAELTKPIVQTQVRQHWGPFFAVDDKNGASERSAESSASAGDAAEGRSASSGASQTAGDMTAQGGAAQQSSEKETGWAAASGESDVAAAQSDSGTNEAGATDQQAETAQSGEGEATAQSGEGQKTAQGENIYAMVTETLVTTLVPPLVAKQSQIKGATVVDSNGQPVGDIESLFIDVDRGYVTIATIGQGGFLGLGDTERAIPFQALRWQEEETFSLNVSGDKLKQVEGLPENLNGAELQQSDVEKLYQAYNLRPVWEIVAEGETMMQQKAGQSDGSGSSQQMNRSGSAGGANGMSDPSSRGGEAGQQN